MSAVPDLLEALINVTMWLRVQEEVHGELKGGAAQSLVDADSAIKKATGAK